MKKIKLSTERLDEMAIEYLSKEYESGYVEETLKKKIKIPKWDLITQSYKAGVYGLLAELKKNDALRKSIIDYTSEK